VQNLASKDPAWFRQTADRGLNSPAYRKNQVEDEDRLDHGSSSAKVQMPGMLREGSMGQTSPEESSSRSSSPTRRNTESRATYQSSSGLGSPMPLTSAQKLDPPNESRPDARSLAMSPSQGRISPERLERPASPTKGMGGFVQSAMMKRSDSVNKRWSVQSPPGLSRGNSMAGNRNSADPGSSFGLGNSLGPTGSVRDSKSTSLNRETSPPPSSRPVSSHSNITATQEHPGAAGSIRSSMTPSTSTMDGSMKGSLPIATIQTSIGLNTAQDEHPSDPSPPKGETTPPTSPSKVMDARRWSPTKASWLESALNKPESPKPKSVAPPQQPAWMSEINKAKQKTSVDLGRTSSTAPKHEVNIGGLMRSPPPGGIVKPISIGGLPAGFSPGPNSRSRPEGASNTSRDSSKPAESSDMPTLSPLSSMISTTGSKVKPETPPKKDFRAGLKPRQPSSDTSGVSEPEFKNVFGQLRRTKTQNYVAPDELKDNITRGKAALNLTGGPKKTERRDEFKEAILKKKDDFKKAQSEGKGVTRSTSSAGQDVPLPEALAKRRALGRSDSITTASSSGISDSPSSQRIAPDSPKPSQVQETSSFGRLQAKEPPVSKLAGRLNPGLANLLARGPPSSDKPRSSSPASTQRADNISASSAEALEAGPQLTHMTKGRARGPRRKAPTSTSVTTNAPSNSVDQLIVKPVGRADPDPVAEESTGIKASSPIKDTVQKLPAPADTENEVSQPTSPRKLDLKRRSQFLQEAPNKNSRAESQLGSPKPLSPTKKANSFEVPVRSPETQSEAVFLPSPKPKPNTPAKSPSLSSKTSSITSPKDSPGVARPRQSPLSPTKPTISGKADEMPSFRRAFPPETHISGDQDDYEPIHFEVESTSVKTVAALWNRPSGTNVTQNIPRVSSPIKLPTHEDEKAALVGAGLRSPSPVRGKAPAGLQIQGAPSPRPLPIPPSRGIKSPPLSAGLSPSTDPSSAISDFFSSRRSSKDFRVDTATLLATRPPQGENIKTLRSSLYQLSSDGKKQMVPSHQERILFEGNLYLCIHTYGDATGKKVTEVYFWQGDDVPRKTVDQVKVFAQKEAKAAGGRFVAIAQGKETPEFFSALGGIIIIRRGSSNKYDSLAPHILCCRKYFGQIVFDEVDFSPASLCSGFPYLISTRTGNSYLWKGKGSGIEELSCARLIGMDFGLTGEVEEVDDGNETPAFLKAFDDAAIPKSADHWRMKPNYSKYCTRLYRADSSIKEQVNFEWRSIASESYLLIFFRSWSLIHFVKQILIGPKSIS